MTSPTAATGTRSIDLSDINQDGHVDVIAAYTGGTKVAWFENDGSAEPGFSEHIVSTTVSNPYRIFAGDMNGDTYFDIVVSSPIDKTIYWFEHDGSVNPGFSEHQIVSDMTSVQGFEVGDVNKDGHLDVAAVSMSHTPQNLVWFENDGSSTPSFSEHGISTNLFEAKFVHLTDINADGLLDMVVSSSIANISWWENEMTPAPNPQPEINLKGNDVSILSGHSTPSALDDTQFGDVFTEGGSLQHTFTIENTGDADLVIAGISESSTHFTISGPAETSIAAGGSTTFTVTFAPQSVGQQSTVISIANNDADESAYTFTVEGTGVEPPKPELEVSNVGANPTSVYPGGTTNFSFTVTNSGTGDSSATLVNDIRLSSNNTITSQDGLLANANMTTVFAGANKTSAQSVTIPAETVPGTYYLGVITDADDANDEDNETNNTGAVMITVVPLPEPEIEVKGNSTIITDGDNTPSDSDDTEFDELDISAGPVTHTFTIENSGDADLTISEITSDSTDFTVNGPLASTVSASGSTTFTVAFDPTTVGEKTGVISIANNDADENPYTFTVHGTGVFLRPEIEVKGNGTLIADGDDTPSFSDDTDFGEQNVGSGSVTHTFTIENSGDAELTISEITSDSSDFAVNGPQASTLASGSSTTFTVAFDPDSIGEKTALISISNNDSDENPFTFAIQGTCTEITFNFIEHVISTTDIGSKRVYAGDIDGDGDMDVVSASTFNDQINEKVSWHENTAGDGSSWISTKISTSQHNQSVVYVDDINNDGYQDILSGWHDCNTYLGGACLNWYQNDGNANPGFSKEVKITSNIKGVYSLVAGDIDGDGDKDVITASHYDNTVAWYENNNGDGSAWSQNVITTSADGTLSVYSVDLDRDGDMDVIAAYTDSNTVAWFENDGNPDPAFDEHIISNSVDSARMVFAEDINGDGYIDIIATSPADDSILWFKNNGNSSSTFSIDAISITFEGATSVSAGDMDNDGDMDIVVSSPDLISWFENNGSLSPTFTKHDISTNIYSAKSLYLVDIDGDGALDIIAGATVNNLSWWENPLPTAPTSEINLKGNNISIVNGDTSPSISDDTDFGEQDISIGTATHTFTIENSGNADLMITEITSDSTDFIISGPASSTVAASSNATFTIAFAPTTIGEKNAVITISSNDPYENPFTFSVQGTGVLPVLAAGIYDDAHFAFLYSGTWSQTDVPGATEGHWHVSAALDSQVEASFEGRQLGVIFGRNSDFGTLSVYIDDVLTDTIDQNGTGLELQLVWNSPELSAGEHTLKLVQASGTHAVIDGLIVREQALQDVVPDVPGLLTPESNAVLYECQPEFSWSDVANASQYEINILPYGSNGAALSSLASTASFTPSSVLRPDWYYWRTRALNGTNTGNWSSESWFKINIGAANNVSPTTNYGTYDLRPTFDWSDVCGADGYDLYAVRYDEIGTPQTAIYADTTASEYTPPSNLTPGVYAWYVRAKSGTEYGPWNTFYWLTLFIGAPNLQTPVTNDLVTPYPEFTWTTVAGAAGYDLFVVKIAGEGNTTAIYEEYIPTTSYTDTDPLESGIYAWYVRARAGHWVGPWTNFYWFVVP